MNTNPDRVRDPPQALRTDAADRKGMREPAAEHVPAAAQEGTHDYAIVLAPLSHPDLGEIRIDDNLFAVGRTEPPFKSYPPEVVADLSRRHARIFCEYGAVYIADLDSKNGTTVNGTDVRQQIARLRDGDTIAFGRTLSYQVRLRERTEKRPRDVKLVSLTLTPDRDDLGLHPIVITRFPFLISKADDAFSRYKEQYPHQVTYISRRHAHIFLKNGAPFIEDLGSTNGTFVDGNRLEEHAVPLEEGKLLALGGHHFVYRVSLQQERIETDPTLTMFSPAPANEPGMPAAAGGVAAPADAAAKLPSAGETEKTIFVAAPDSFLEIFCVDQAQQQKEDAADAEAKPPGAEGGKRRPRGKFALLASQLHEAFAEHEGKGKGRRRTFGWGAALLVLLGAGAFALYLRGAPEREVNELIARGDFAAAAAAADRHLESRPDSAQLKALSTEALLRETVPKWSALIRARNFDGAQSSLADMKRLGSHNNELPSLTAELEWIGSLERFMVGRGGADAPVRIFADEEKIRVFLKGWETDSKEHQRVMTRIASTVPEFRDVHAEALSHLRKLQSDDSVYLAAIDRLKASIDTELGRGRPEQLEPVLKEYAQKYPRLAGLDAIERDLNLYTMIDGEARARKLGSLVTQLAQARFSTPPFQQKLRALQAENRLPSEEMIRQYQAASSAWREGNAKQSIAGLQQISGAPWSEVAAGQIEHRKAVLDQFAELEKARGTGKYDERLLSFYASLDRDEDVYFLRAIDRDVGAVRNKALKQAQDLLGRAQDQWRRYRENGAIEGGQRLEPGISNRFRAQARLLSGAREDAQQGIRIYSQLKADYPPQWNKIRDEINAESELQRRSLLELNRVLEPGLLKAKLSLLAGQGGEEQR